MEGGNEVLEIREIERMEFEVLEGIYWGLGEVGC